MTASTLATDALLALSVLITAMCCLALVLVRNVFDRMHYLAPVTTIAMLALLFAVVIKEGWGQASFKTILVFFTLLLINAVLTHATARAARVRQFGHWIPKLGENIAGAPGGRQPRKQKEGTD
jgi:monovalent cation/proton antiporter MnhG/PhaG subunit